MEPRTEKTPTDSIGWGAANNAYAQNKHTIPIYSFEPPTAQHNRRCFYNKNTGVQTMKTFITTITATVIGIASAYASHELNCNPDTDETFLITHGTRKVIYAAYVKPNCKNGCRCSDCSWYSQCTCDNGYYAIGQHTCHTLCNCDGVCPANSTCTDTDTFKCNRGYYKDGPVCTRCPQLGNVYGTTASNGAKSISECYLPSGTSGSDATGTFEITQKCYY